MSKTHLKCNWTWAVKSPNGGVLPCKCLSAANALFSTANTARFLCLKLLRDENLKLLPPAVANMPPFDQHTGPLSGPALPLVLEKHNAAVVVYLPTAST